MIAWLEGELRAKAPARAVVAVGGVGYEALIPLSTFTELPEPGKTVALHVHTHVREDALQLYGFATPLERDVFELLLRASGVGPRLALAVLSGLDAERAVTAIRDGAIATLRGVPGIGQKMAEKIVVELRDRAAELSLARVGPAGSTAPEPAGADEAVSALVNLGYPRPQAQRLVDEATAELGPGADLERTLRAALRRSAR